MIPPKLKINCGVLIMEPAMTFIAAFLAARSARATSKKCYSSIENSAKSFHPSE
jgi:hypothetical protein